MIGSLLSRMSQANNLSIPQLQQAVQDGTLPAYVGIPLIQDRMRQQQQATQAQQAQAAQQQAQQPPIAQQVLQQAQQSQTAPLGQIANQAYTAGIDNLKSNLPTEKTMAGGGIVAFADGGMFIDPEDPASYQDAQDLNTVQGANPYAQDQGPDVAGTMQQALAQSNDPTQEAINNVGGEGAMYSTPSDMQLSGLPTNTIPNNTQSFAGTTLSDLKGQLKDVGHKYKDLIVKTAKDYGVDPILALNVAHNETGAFKHPERAVSSAGAIGVMQLMPNVAKEYGVNPHNIQQNIEGGIALLKDLSDKYKGNPALVMAAYNAGQGRVDHLLARHAGIDALPTETQNYLHNAGYAAGGIVAFKAGGDTTDNMGVNPDQTESWTDATNVPSNPLLSPDGTVNIQALTSPSRGAKTYFNEGLNPTNKTPPSPIPNSFGVDTDQQTSWDNTPFGIDPSQQSSWDNTPFGIADGSWDNAPQNTTANSTGGIDYSQFKPDAADFSGTSTQTQAPAQASSSTPDYLSSFADALDKNQQNIDTQQKQAPWLALMNAGFTMMGAQTPNPFVALSQAGQAGISTLAAQNKAVSGDIAAQLGAQGNLARSQVMEQARKDQISANQLWHQERLKAMDQQNQFMNTYRTNAQQAHQDYVNNVLEQRNNAAKIAAATKEAALQTEGPKMLSGIMTNEFPGSPEAAGANAYIKQQGLNPYDPVAIAKVNQARRDFLTNNYPYLLRFHGNMVTNTLPAGAKTVN